MRRNAGRNEKGQFIKGHSENVRHGGYVSSSGSWPLRVRRFLENIRESLIREKGPRIEDITTPDLIRIEKAVNVLQVTMSIEAYIRREGIFRGKKLDPILRESYLAYVNSLRLLLRELNITEKAKDSILDPLALAAAIDAEKTKDDQGKREIADSGASESETEAEEWA
ncbi:MAG: hypothetical protein PHX45_00085 [Acidobacteriota bacterium]|nr:hypothetical protein [Acidobacteriota bacterium]